jgi:hypothetical protein
MAINFGGIENALRGDPYGQLPPESQGLSSQFQDLYRQLAYAPMTNINYGGQKFKFLDPVTKARVKLMASILAAQGQMQAQNRSKTQPGLISQFGPAAGRLAALLAKKVDPDKNLVDYTSPGNTGEDWWSGADYDPGYSTADYGTGDAWNQWTDTGDDYSWIADLF